MVVKIDSKKVVFMLIDHALTQSRAGGQGHARGDASPIARATKSNSARDIVPSLSLSSRENAASFCSRPQFFCSQPQLNEDPRILNAPREIRQTMSTLAHKPLTYGTLTLLTPQVPRIKCSEEGCGGGLTRWAIRTTRGYSGLGRGA